MTAPKYIPSLMLLDKRVVDRNVRKGWVTRDAVQKHLTGLPDLAGQAETVRAQLLDEDVEEADGAEG